MTKKRTYDEILAGINERNPTVKGPTGPLPRPRNNPAKVYKIEKARREAKSPNYLYAGSSSPYVNPRTVQLRKEEKKTFRQFITEAIVKRISNLTREPDRRKSPYKLNKAATRKISSVLTKHGFDPIDALERPENPIDIDRRNKVERSKYKDQ